MDIARIVRTVDLVIARRALETIRTIFTTKVRGPGYLQMCSQAVLGSGTSSAESRESVQNRGGIAQAGGGGGGKRS